MGLTKHAVVGRVVASLLAGILVLSAGCTPHKQRAQASDMAPAPAASVQESGRPAPDQTLFATPDEAVKTMLAAVKSHDRESLHRIFGPAGQELVSGDRVEDRNDREAFAKKADERARVQMNGDKSATLFVGNEDWPFPIPLVRTPDGKWFFDTAAGKDEVLARRIGDNELSAIDACYAYVQAQRQYAGKDRDASGVLQYAQHFMSTDDRHDGLYWKAQPGQEQSPLGPLVAEARAEGYTQARGPSPHPYHGYYFRILTRQGPSAPGGKYDYIINGHMIAGFGLVAWPDKYGSSGVMTFVVSHQGVVYQKDLGPRTGQIASEIREFNPDNTWTRVKD